jgi:hypothetical protein
MNISVSNRNRRFFHCLAVVLFTLLAAASIRAQVVIAPVSPVIGSANTVSADPRIAVPDTKSCTVTLFNNLEFADFNTKDYTYTPPASCPGPWAKVVFSADFTVTAGRQYDRTEQFYLGGATLLFGTTPEPRSTLSPSWHVERDVTDLSSIFTAPQAGTALLGNFVGVYNGVDYTGIIYANAQLTFYQASREHPAPLVPNQVIGIPGNSGAAALSSSSSVYTQNITLPTNVTSAYLDVIAESQSNDEFWYTCVPNDLASELQSCGGSGFRETEITIDGTPAGVAPVYPWIYTGGIDPYLWQPIPGVQTLNFEPFRVDLTPFAGPLSDGKTHTVGIQVYNADSYFQVAANLLVYTDPFLKHVTGSIDTNTLAAEPAPDVANTIATDSSGNITGTVTIVSNRAYTIAGSVTTWHGPVRTAIHRTVDFTQTQTFNITQTQYSQAIVQSTKVDGDTEHTSFGLKTRQSESYSYPFSLGYTYAVNSDGTSYQTTHSSQQDIVNLKQPGGWPGWNASNLSNTVTAQDTLNFDANGNFTGHTASSSSQDYVSADSLGGCYSEKLSSAGGILTGAVRGSACHRW